MPSTRRRFLRRAGAGATALGVAATAGCTAPRVVSATADGGRHLDSPQLDAAAFDRYVAAARDRWGDHGVFGRSEPPSSVEFLGAWTDGATVENPADGLVAARFALVSYHLGESADGDRLDAWVLWAAAERAAPTVDVPAAGPVTTDATVRLRGLGVGIDFDGPVDVIRYDPGGDVRGDQTATYRAGPGAQFEASVAATVPLDSGVVAPVAPETWDGAPGTGFDADAYTVGWTGRSAGPVSVTGVCTTRLPPGIDRSVVELRWRHHVAAGGYLRL
jgi:hypothetical protein